MRSRNRRYVRSGLGRDPHTTELAIPPVLKVPNRGMRWGGRSQLGNHPMTSNLPRSHLPQRTRRFHMNKEVLIKNKHLRHLSWLTQRPEKAVLKP